MKKSFINVNFIKKCQLGVKKKFYKLYKIEIDEKKFYKRDFYDAEVKKSFINVIFMMRRYKKSFGCYIKLKIDEKKFYKRNFFISEQQKYILVQVFL